MRRLLAVSLLLCLLVSGWPGALGIGEGPGDPVGTVVRVLTQPDVGPGGATVRWPGPRVRARFDLGGYPAWFVDDGAATLGWAAEVTGLDVVVVDSGPADLVVVPGPGSGAMVRVYASAGSIRSAVVDVGCCRVRALREDLLQAFGPMGDHAATGSVFSQDLSAVAPSYFDRWTLQILYALEPGSDAAEVRRCAEASVSRLWSVQPRHLAAVCPLGSG